VGRVPIGFLGDPTALEAYKKKKTKKDFPTLSASSGKRSSLKVRATVLERLSVILIGTLLPRFARRAVVASFDQNYLRISCSPFYLREIQKLNVSGKTTPDVCPSVLDNQPLQKETKFE
jgi:hypothetical protein